MHKYTQANNSFIFFPFSFFFYMSKMSSAFVKFTAIRNLLSRRSLHITSTARTDAVRSEGATTSTKGFGDKEKAEEALWARKHVKS